MQLSLEYIKVTYIFLSSPIVTRNYLSFEIYFLIIIYEITKLLGRRCLKYCSYGCGVTKL